VPWPAVFCEENLSIRWRHLNQRSRHAALKITISACGGVSASFNGGWYRGRGGGGLSIGCRLNREESCAYRTMKASNQKTIMVMAVIRSVTGCGQPSIYLQLAGQPEMKISALLEAAMRAARRQRHARRAMASCNLKKARGSGCGGKTIAGAALAKLA
jgi:hypothetical protein